MRQERIALEDVSLRYRLAKKKTGNFKEYAIDLLRGSLSYEAFWALKGVNLRVCEAETVGIVGKNGAGKSSLLKVISGILKPTQGRRFVSAAISPILGLGAGFDYELTGIENIYLNALMMGRRQREITAKLPEIIEFSGIEQFIDSPIRNYSSGMIAKIGFATATAWIPEILILDEVLSVGDAEFTSKCRARLKEFSDAGTTLLLVSHNFQAIRENCARCIWLDQGRVMADGLAEEVLTQYKAATVPNQPSQSEK